MTHYNRTYTTVVKTRDQIHPCCVTMCADCLTVSISQLLLLLLLQILRGDDDDDDDDNDDNDDDDGDGGGVIRGSWRKRLRGNGVTCVNKPLSSRTKLMISTKLMKSSLNYRMTILPSTQRFKLCLLMKMTVPLSRVFVIWQGLCMSSCDECSPAAGGCRPTDQANRLAWPAYNDSEKHLLYSASLWHALHALNWQT